MREVEKALRPGFSDRVLGFFGKPPTFEIYTDGSAKDGWGSWAFLICKKGKPLFENSGRVSRGHSNSMELQAAIQALRSLPQNSKAILFSDSRILIDAMTRGEFPPVYQSQIDTLIQLNQEHRISWRWIKAHNANPFNERCDELCRSARGSGYPIPIRPNSR